MNLQTLPAFDNFFKAMQSNMIGFDEVKRLFDEGASCVTKNALYPPYNIRKVGDNEYVIELAVAGFGKNDITVTFEDGTLKIVGKSSLNADLESYLHKGVAGRDFFKNFALTNDVEIKSADLTNGMLRVWLERLIPDHAKPRQIPIVDGESETTERATVKALGKDKK